MREPAVTCDGTGVTREYAVARNGIASVRTGNIVWKHFTRQLAMSGHIFCGQSGQGLAGLWLASLWQGMSPIADGITLTASAIAGSPCDVVDTTATDPSIANMPRMANQR